MQPVEKRAAILLDKIMYAVQKALDEDRNGKGAGGAANMASFTSVSQQTGRDHVWIYLYFYFFYNYILGDGLNSFLL